MDLCVMEPTGDTDIDTLIELYKKFVSLKALEFCSTSISHYCAECDSILDKGSLLTYFPFLEFCLIYDIHCLTVQDIIDNCKQLKYFNCSSIRGDVLLPVSSSNLQQLDIDSDNLDLSDEFMNILSAHGGLIRVVLNVGTVSIEGITVLVENSPNLLLLHVNGLETPAQEPLVITFKEKFCQSKLFTRGSFKLLDTDFEEVEHNTNLLSLWSDSFLTDVKIDNISSDNDNLSAAYLDGYQTDPFAGLEDFDDYQTTMIMCGQMSNNMY